MKTTIPSFPVKALLLLLSVLVYGKQGGDGLKAQNSVFLKKQVPEDHKFKPENVIDSVYGVEIYEPLNFRLGGDSVRQCDGYACRGWVEDEYENDQLLHKGYYVDGQLKIYKNFYPDGTLEREFKISSKLKSELVKYYPSGDVKSEVTYVGEYPLEWTDRYRNGQLKYYEKYDDGRNYHIERKEFQKDGTPVEKFEMVDEDEKRFVKKAYHENGELKTKGELKYNEDLFELQRHGEWKHYDEEGELERSESFDEGDKL